MERWGNREIERRLRERERERVRGGGDTFGKAKL
jgi:hypothetical protein